MSKHDMSDLMSYRPPYPLVILHSIIINDKIVLSSPQMLCLCVRSFFVYKKRIGIAAIIP